MLNDIETLRHELNERLTRGIDPQLLLPQYKHLDQLISWYTNKGRTCCFTGHRPQRFKFPSEDDCPGLNALKASIRNKIITAVDSGYNHFISGGFLGADTWCAQELIQMKKTMPEIKFELVLPCINQSSRWTKSQKAAYTYLCEKADIVTYTSKLHYRPGCIERRNEFVVERCSRIIAVYYGGGGFVGRTIDYATKNSVDIIYV